MTGSVNQHGEVQPVGAVNAKVEGFYEVCRQGSLTGEQGVLVPRVVEAVRMAEAARRFYGGRGTDGSGDRIRPTRLRS